MVKEALFLTHVSLQLNPMDAQYIGTMKKWNNKCQFMKLCRTGIRLAQHWLRQDIFHIKNIYIKNITFVRIGWGAKKRFLGRTS